MSSDSSKPVQQPEKRAWHAPDFEEADISEVTEAGAGFSPIYDGPYTYTY
jgi:hypothetical protein